MSEKVLSPSTSLYEQSMSALLGTFKHSFNEPKVDYIVGNFLERTVSPSQYSQQSTEHQYVPYPTTYRPSSLEQTYRPIDYNDNMLMVDYQNSLQSNSIQSLPQDRKYSLHYENVVPSPPYSSPSLPIQDYQYVPSNSSEYFSSFTCPVKQCSQQFHSKQMLEEHKMSHSPDKLKPFACTKCNQAFSRSHDLKRHMYIHSQEKPFSCTRCGRGFSRRDALRRHEKALREGKKVHCVPFSTHELFYNVKQQQ